MDTINIKIETMKPIAETDVPKVKRIKNINNLKILGSCSYSLIISIPRAHYINNVYLVTTESEVHFALEYVIKKLKEYNYQTLKLEVTKVDYPFTYLRRKGEDFNSHRQILELFSMCADFYGYKSKHFGKRSRRENYILRNSLIPGKSRGGISIYDPHLKLVETEKMIKSRNILKDYPDLVSRTRIEVSMRHRRVLKDIKDLNLKEVKRLAYNEISEVVFRNISEVKENSIKLLISALKREREERGNSFKLATFIRDYKDIIFDYSLLKKAIKKAYPNCDGAKYACKVAKRELLRLEESEKVFYIGNLKRIDEIKKNLKRESNASTRSISKIV